MAIRVGRWDCKVCGHKGNLGPETKCVSCAASRPPDVKFYLAADAEIVQDEERIREARSGVDWVCGHCQSHNKAMDTVCYSCGNEKDKLSQDVDLETRVYTGGTVPQTGERPEDAAGERYRREHRAITDKQKVNKSKGVFSIGLIAVIALIVTAVFLLRSFPKDIDVTVSGFEWKRTIQFEHYEPVVHEDWQTPRGAFEITSFRDIHHYDKVFRGYETRERNVQVQVGTDRYVCGQRDMGNGYFEDVYCDRPIYENRKERYQVKVYDDIPVYATKYRYKLMEWTRKKQNLLTASRKDHEAKWPDPPSTARLQPNNWREGPKKENYHIWVKEDDGDVHQHEITYQSWSKLKQGSVLKAQKSLIFDVYYGLK